MSYTDKELGKRGEKVAGEYLLREGYQIIARNFFHSKSGEIDIIARKDDIYIFAEVRTRSSSDYISPEDTITASKRKKIIRTAEAYIDIHNLEDYYARFDVISVLMKNDEPEIEHIIEAFTK